MRERKHKAVSDPNWHQLAARLLLPGGIFTEDAMQAFVDGNAESMLTYYSNDEGLEIVSDNRKALRRRGIYEEALVVAYTSARTNWPEWPLKKLRRLFDGGDRARLLGAGDLLPPGDCFRLYRGVAGRAPNRKIPGLSWTRSRARAAWFAIRYEDLPDPAVYQTEASREDIYVYVNDRGEDEFLLSARSYIRLGPGVLTEATEPKTW